jgi:hypothetical protein
MRSIELTITASSILFGFLFAGFWWALDRELRFKPEERHFKFGYFLLILTMAVLAIFGILLPLRATGIVDPAFSLGYRWVALVLVGVFGYMLTEFGHYSVFQWPKYTTTSEHVFFWLTIVSMVTIAVWALI